MMFTQAGISQQLATNKQTQSSDDADVTAVMAGLTCKIQQIGLVFSNHIISALLSSLHLYSRREDFSVKMLWKKVLVLKSESEKNELFSENVYNKVTVHVRVQVHELRCC